MSWKKRERHPGLYGILQPVGPARDPFQGIIATSQSLCKKGLDPTQTCYRLIKTESLILTYTVYAFLAVLPAVPKVNTA